MAAYEKIETGIHRFYHRFRATVGVNGKNYQQYFDKLEDARQWREGMRNTRKTEKRAGRTHVPTTKRTKGIKHKELPVGICGTTRHRMRADGTIRIERYVNTYITDGSGNIIKTFTAAYNRSLRTKAEATEIVRERRAKFEEWYWGNGKKNW